MKYSIKLIVFTAERCVISTSEYRLKAQWKKKLIFDSFSITMPSCVFEQTIKKLSGVGEVAKINVTNGKAVLSSKGDIGEVETELDEKDNDDPKNKLFSVEAQGTIELNYSCK